MLETVGVRPGGKMCAALLSEMFLEADVVNAGVGIARGDGAADAWVAAFKGDFADVEADYAAKFGAEELVFPEGWDAVEFQGGAETLTGSRDSHAGKPFADGLEGGGGDDGGAVGDEVVWDAGRIVANHDGVAQECTEPFGCLNGVSRECECRDRGVAAVMWNCESNGCEAGFVRGANDMQRGDASRGDQAAIQRIDRPGTVELEAAGGAYGGGGDFYGIEGFDGMDLDAGQAGKYWFRFHDIILTESLGRDGTSIATRVKRASDHFGETVQNRHIACLTAQACQQKSVNIKVVQVYCVNAK
jgi:hypothetical protein